MFIFFRHRPLIVDNVCLVKCAAITSISIVIFALVLKPFHHIFLLFTVILFAFNSCRKESSFSEIPALVFKEYKIFGNDSLHLIFSFTDGDGDLGITEGDTFPPFNPAAFSYNNLFLYYQSMNADSTFNYFIQSLPNNQTDSLKWRFRYRNITPTGQRKVLEGDITATLKSPFRITIHENYRYEIFMFDRALRKSNIIYSPLIK